MTAEEKHCNFQISNALLTHLDLKKRYSFIAGKTSAEVQNEHFSFFVSLSEIKSVLKYSYTLQIFILLCSTIVL